MAAPKNFGFTAQTNVSRSSKARRPSLRELITFNFRVLIFPKTPENAAQLKRLKEQRRAERSKDSKPRMAGVIIGLVGLALLLVTIFLHEAFHPQKLKFVYDLSLVFFGHLGIAGLLLGAVSIIVEFKNWTEYFETRLGNTIQKKEFLHKLSDEELGTLLKNVYLAIHKLNSSDEDSFLEFFGSKIQQFIPKPFREDTSSVITIGPRGSDGIAVVHEHISYMCTKTNAQDSTLQPEIKWLTDLSDMVEGFQDYEVSLVLPDKRPKSFRVPKDFKPLANETDSVSCKKPSELGSRDNPIVLPKGHDRLEEQDNKHGYRLSLEEFQDLDWLKVRETAEYKISSDRFQAWTMPYPSRGFRVVINYPDTMGLHVEVFGMDPANVLEVKQDGVYSLTYDSWLLPYSGLVYRLTEKEPLRAIQGEIIAANYSRIDHNGGGSGEEEMTTDTVEASGTAYDVAVRATVESAQQTAGNGEFDLNLIGKSFDKFKQNVEDESGR